MTVGSSPYRVEGDGGFGDLRGQVAVVTGGNSGIGLGISRGLVAAGCVIAVLGTKRDRTADAAAELTDRGPGAAHAFVCDVGDEAAVVDVLAAVRDELGPVTAVFASAGVPSARSSFVDLSLTEFRRVTRVNLEGVFLTFREGARHMIRDGVPGSLVAVASLAAIHGQVRGQAYSASKGGVVALVRGCAVELARHGIRVNAILPGSIDTPMAAPFQHTDAWEERIRTRIPQRRAGQADELAGAAVYLASRSSSYHTGDTLVIDGGYSVF